MNSEKEIMGFASVAFKKPWVSLVERFSQLENGEKIQRQQALVDPFFAPFPLDARLVHVALKSGSLRLFMGKNPTLFTLVLNKKRDKLVWACVESAQNGIYNELHELKSKLNEPWANRALHFIKNDNLPGCHAYLKNWLSREKDLSHIKLGSIKVASLNLFDAFLQAFEEGKQKPFIKQQSLYLSALVKVLKEKDVRFYPAVPFYRIVQAGEWIARFLPAAASA